MRQAAAATTHRQVQRLEFFGLRAQLGEELAVAHVHVVGSDLHTARC
jgi:hypothetical protein